MNKKDNPNQNIERYYVWLESDGGEDESLEKIFSQASLALHTFYDLEIENITRNDTNFEDCSFSSTKLKSSSFANCSFDRSSLFSVTASNSNFDNSTFRAAVLSDVYFKNCSFRNVDFTQVNFQFGTSMRIINPAAQFTDCDLTGAKFREDQLEFVEFDDCTM